MAKALILSMDGREFAVKLEKIDRERLYGRVKIEAFDENGGECFLTVLASNGQTLINEGGTALAKINERGQWVDRKDLAAVDANGEIIENVPSSFNAPNAIFPATENDYLSHIVKSVYFLETSEAEDAEYLESCFSTSPSRLLKFDFSYRGGLGYDTAFLIKNDNGTFMIIGEPSRVQFVGLNQMTMLDDETDVSIDELDFDLL